MLIKGKMHDIIDQIDDEDKLVRFYKHILYINEGQVWMDMIESRNNTVHTYREDILEKECTRVTEDYFPQFEDFLDKMREFL